MSTGLVLEELTPEGRAMWENLSRYDVIVEGKSLLPTPPKPKKVKVDPVMLENAFLRHELMMLKANSERVVEDCDKIMVAYSTREQYLASEPKVAKFCHQNLIKRIENILEFKPAFAE